MYIVQAKGCEFCMRIFSFNKDDKVLRCSYKLNKECLQKYQTGQTEENDLHNDASYTEYTECT